MPFWCENCKSKNLTGEFRDQYLVVECLDCGDIVEYDEPEEPCESSPDNMSGASTAM